MQNSDRVFWLCIGVLLGVLIGLMLSQRPPAPPPPKDAAAKAPHEGANISDADFRREGQSA